MLHRSDHDYNEAIKAYKQALKVDPKNLQILRDLSMLQIQLRDMDGFAVTRNTLLALKPNAKINWMAFGLARHLSGDLVGAVAVIDIYLGTLTEGSAELGRSYESSELALYKNQLLAEQNEYAKALQHLDECAAVTVDRGAWLMMRAEYQVRLRQFENAIATIHQLLDRGMTEDHRIHSLYQCALLQIEEKGVLDPVLRLRGTQTLVTFMPLAEEQISILRQAYEHELPGQYPKSAAIQRIAISMMDDASFRQSIDARCRSDLRRGVPSLCAELQSYLWTSSDKTNRFVRTIDPVDVRRHARYQLFVTLVDEYISHLERSGRFAADSAEEEEPSTLFWAWYLRAGLHEMAGEYVEGLARMDQCLQHTPTAVDAYEMKARLWKLSGNISAAVACLDRGRDLDRADRYINNQTTRYMLQAGMEQEALQRISMFTRHEGNPEQNLYDMQCSWYELELAACLARKGDWGRSLKKYGAVVKHFHDFQEDQFDFHSYCLRKVTLRAYVSVLRFEDEVYGQEYFCQAAAGIIRIYLYMHDHPTMNAAEEPDYSKMDAAERKKAKAVARKKKKASEKKESVPPAAAGSNETEATANGGNKAKKAAVTDEDPLGLEYLKKDPLSEAKKYSQMLAQFAPQNLETWILQYDTALRRKKPLLCLQALFKARAVDEDSHELFTRIVDFSHAQVSSLASTAPPSVQAVLTTEMPRLWQGHASVTALVVARAAERDADLWMRTAQALALVQLQGATALSEAVRRIVPDGMAARKVTVESCQAAWAALEALGATAAAQEWAAHMAQRFPVVKEEENGIEKVSMDKLEEH